MNARHLMGKYAKPLIIGFIVLVVVSFLVGFIGGALGVDFGLLPMFLGLFAGAFTAYILANLTGTEPTRAASEEDKTRALQLQAPAGQALVLVFREGFVGSAAGINILLDGRKMAQLKSPRFTAFPVAPGEHTLHAAFGGLAGAQANPGAATFRAAEGDVLAWQAVILMGALKNTVSMVPVTADAELAARLRRVTMVAAEPNG